jgi:ATPase family protein associated with various cellular activities (AAA)
MKRVGERVLTYLLARQKRTARLEAFGRALDAGLLEREPIGGDERSGFVWNLDPDASEMFCGDVERDRKVISALLARTSKDEHSHIVPEDAFSEPWAQNQGRIESSETSERGPRSTEPSTCPATVTRSAYNKSADLRDHVLLLIARCSAAPKVTEVTTALLLARAVDQSGYALGRLLAFLKSRTAIIALAIPVRDFERNFGLLLEDGLVMPFYVSLDPIADGPTLTGRYQPLADYRRRKSFACLGSTSLEKYDDDELRSVISRKVLTTFKPLVICDETPRPLPARLVALADLMIEGSGIDRSMIADVLAVCVGIPTSRSLSLMTELGFDPQHLGIDDLAIAMRPGRSLRQIVSILSTLDAENAAHAESADDDEQGGAHARMRRKWGRIGSQDLGQKTGSFDVIEPARFETASKSAEPVETQSGETPSSDRNHLFVEHLAGYGEAKKWALDIKLDLDAFRNGDVSWSDLSTRLLLSGPPGTGKTTFARALGNTLQIPLVATSVARWLELSNLGEVLAAMSATFKYASSHPPCILFVDEIDNIGSRGNASGDFRDDYWASLINRLLELLDGAAKTEGVIVVGATNRPEKIDRALLRSGRLEKHIVIQPPDTEALVGIIAHHLGGDLDAVMRGIGTQTGLERANG